MQAQGMVLPTVDWVFLPQLSRQCLTDRATGQPDPGNPSIESLFSNGCRLCQAHIRLGRLTIEHEVVSRKRKVEESSQCGHPRPKPGKELEKALLSMEKLQTIPVLVIPWG